MFNAVLTNTVICLLDWTGRW